MNFLTISTLSLWFFFEGLWSINNPSVTSRMLPPGEKNVISQIFYVEDIGSGIGLLVDPLF